jgi:hypothetical protein
VTDLVCRSRWMEGRLLKLFLGFAGVLFGCSVFGVFASREAGEEALRGLGAKGVSARSAGL